MCAAGVLIIAHGSRNPKWNHLVELVVRNIRSTLPIRVSYLDFVEGKQIEDGIRDLERLGLKQIMVIPLFVTMGSTHLDEIQYALGLIQNPAIDTDMQAIRTHAEIIWCPPLEDHDFVYQIISERILNLSENPSEEVLLLIGHGSEHPQFHEVWEELLQRMTINLRRRFGFKGVSYATLHPDVIERRAKALARKNKLLVIPIFLSEGYFTNIAIPARLEGLSCLYDGRAYLPHPLIGSWLESMIDQAVRTIELTTRKLA